MPFAYPISLEVGGRAAVVIGEEAVVQGKADTLLDAGASVRVVAEGPSSLLDELENRGARVSRRGYLPGDLEGAFLCVAASADPEVRAAIHQEAMARHVLVNVMDDVPHCDFAAPAVMRRGDLAIAVSTGGRSPALAHHLRVDLQRRFGPEWGTLLDLLGEVRAATLPALPDLRERARRWRSALGEVEGLLELIRTGRVDEARVRLLGALLPEEAA